MKFVPMYDLDRLSKEELQQYYLDACAFHGVPPELNVLAFTYMDSGDGARRRVLYAKKGATDIIRERLGISVADLRKEIFNGTLTYTCFGKNKDGRFEIAVGASYIDGLIGRALEVAIMVAQTRAIRRMTLQFAGAGLIDETELQADSKTTDIKEALTTPQPTVKPNNAVGKDITAVPIFEPDYQEPAPEFRLKPLEQPAIMGIRGAHGVKAIIDALKEPTPAQLEAQQALSKVPEAVLAEKAEETVPEAPKRRQRAKPVELDTPFSFDNPVPVPKSVNADIPESKLTPTSSLIPKEVLDAVPAPIIAKAAFEFLDGVQKATEAVTASVPKSIPELPNDQQMKTFRDRLFTYTNTILPQAGMVPTENIGGIGMKVRLFAQAKYGQVLNQLTVSQWEEMFQWFDSLKPAELVKLIDETALKTKA
jgi:hypothetical protein